MAFIGRKKETLLMQQALEQEQATILLYGKRKVGKTTLIKECLKNQSKQFVNFESKHAFQPCKRCKESDLWDQWKD